MQTTIASIHATAVPQPTVPPTAPTPELVHQLFPFTPLANIAANLPHVLAALAAASLADKTMLLMALATIRAEAEPFLPLTEAESPFNTSPGGRPFDLYDRRRDLGNLAPPDGASFRGRGFVQLTGRANYTRYAQQINQPLVANPSLAASPAIAAQLLACFLAAREPAIRRALAVPPPAGPDLATARRLVNGGTNGLDRFTAAYTIGVRLLNPSNLEPRTSNLT
jgi:peptidoglycan L-alanyl-D-glutamate endopeptidase CwlK